MKIHMEFQNVISGLVCLILLCGVSPLSQAQTMEDDDDDDDNGWNFSIEAGFEREPGYTGSDVYQTEAAFNIEAEYQDGNRTYFFSLGEAGIAWMPDDLTIMRALLEYEPSRENGADPALEGFPEFEDTVEVQVDYERQLGNGFSVGGIAQYDILDRGKGLVGFLLVNYDKELSPRWEFESRIDVSFGDAEHIRTEVGISNATAAVTGFDAYSPSGGYKGITLELGLEFQATENIALFGEIAVEKYGPLMSDSPLIAEAGSDIANEAAIGIRYEF